MKTADQQFSSADQQQLNCGYDVQYYSYSYCKTNRYVAS